jgi:hypothetical protein
VSGIRKEKVGIGRLLGVVVVVALATLAFAGVASATHTESSSPAPYQDSVWGSGEFCIGAGTICGLFHTNAKSEFDGSSPQGTAFAHVTVVATGDREEVYGRVTCLRVVGNRAVVGVEVTKTSNPLFLPVGFGVVAQYDDNGEPGSDPATPDRAFAAPVGPTPPVVCPSPVFPTSPITQGNFVVHDALVGH